MCFVATFLQCPQVNHYRKLRNALQYVHAMELELASMFVFSIFRHIKLEDSHYNKDVEKAFVAASNDVFLVKTKPPLLLANQVGNMYTPSLYGGLASFIFHG